MTNNKNALFSSIFKYRQTKRKTPLEDYCTEIFVYILRQLMASKDKLSYVILNLFGFKNISNKDLEKIEIVTREMHYFKEKIVFPDIIIKLGNKINIIEVKVNSGIRNYILNKEKTINQLKLYKKITDIKINDVFLLSKSIFLDNSGDISNKILWSNIHSILLNSKNEIINNFSFFLEENGMESYSVKKNAENGINLIYALSVIIEESFVNILPKNYILEPNIDWEYNGYYIKYKNENIAWIGQYRENHEYIVFEPLSKKLINIAKAIFENKNENIKIIGEGNIIFTELLIKNITSKSKAEDQIKIIQEWYNEEIKIIFEKQKPALNKSAENLSNSPNK